MGVTANQFKIMGALYPDKSLTILEIAAAVGFIRGAGDEATPIERRILNIINQLRDKDFVHWNRYDSLDGECRLTLFGRTNYDIAKCQKLLEGL